MELLLRRLGAQRDEVSFAMVGAEIWATCGERDDSSRTRGERAEIERRAIVDLLSEVCERSPELEADWFAVSYLD